MRSLSFFVNMLYRLICFTSSAANPRAKNKVLRTNTLRTKVFGSNAFWSKVFRRGNQSVKSSGESFGKSCGKSSGDTSGNPSDKSSGESFGNSFGKQFCKSSGNTSCNSSDITSGIAPGKTKRFLSPVVQVLSVFLLIQLYLTFFQPGKLMAYCDCGTLSRIVNSAAERIINGIATPLELVIQKSAAYATQNVHKDLVSLREAVLMGQQSVTSAIRAANDEQAERELEKTYELSSQPVTSCGNDTMGGELLKSKKSIDDTGEAIMEKVLERRGRFERPVDYLVELSTFPVSDSAPKRFGALSSSLTMSLPELKEAERILEGLSNPLPPAKLPESFENTPAGHIYQIQKRAFETKQSLYQSVLAKRLAERAPTIEGLSEWAASKWRQMGAPGQAPSSEDGRFSQEALMWLLTNMRLSSANWHEQVLPALPEAGLLREMASMMAVELELSRQRNEKLDNISMMLALDGLEKLEVGSGEALRLQYRRAVGAQAQ
jgi:hypothetical protein